MRAEAVRAALGGGSALRVILALIVAGKEVATFATLPPATPRLTLEIIVAIVVEQFLPLEAHYREGALLLTTAERSLNAIVICFT